MVYQTSDMAMMNVVRNDGDESLVHAIVLTGTVPSLIAQFAHQDCPSLCAYHILNCDRRLQSKQLGDESQKEYMLHVT